MPPKTQFVVKLKLKWFFSTNDFSGLHKIFLLILSHGYCLEMPIAIAMAL